MRSCLLLLTVSLVAPAAAAQADNKLYFPNIFANQEGDTADTNLLNQATYIHYQQSDADTTGNQHLVKFLRLRRDAVLDTPGAVGRTVDIQVTMGMGDINSFGNDFNANYLQGTQSVVFARQPVNLPDWSMLPPSGPTPFDLTLATNIWSYQGFFELVWEMEVWSTGPGSYALDATDGTGTFRAATAQMGTGCATNTSGAGGYLDVSSFDVTGWGAASNLVLAGSGAPAGQVVTTLLGVMPVNVPIPGFCGPVRTLPIVIQPIGAADAMGNVSVSLGVGPYPLGWAGTKLYTQQFALSTVSPPAALSSAQEITLPIVPGLQFKMMNTWTTTASATTGNGPNTGGVIYEIDDGVLFR